MNGRSLPVVFRLLELCQLLLAFGGSVSAACFVVQLHQTMKGFFDPDLAITRNFVLPLLHALVAGQQQRFGFGIFLLREQAASEQALRIECEPIIGKLFLANIQAKNRLASGP